MNKESEQFEDEFEDDDFYEDDDIFNDEYDDEDDILDDHEEDNPKDVKYPKVKVQLTGRDGNAFAIMGAVKDGLRKAGVSKEEQDKFMEEAMSGDYNNLLMTCMRWVDVR